MTEELEFGLLQPGKDATGTAAVRRLLQACGLRMDDDVQVFVVARDRNGVVACAGLADYVVKCVAVADEYRGSSLALKLMTEIQHLAIMEYGQSHLFLYTKPENQVLFEGCGFHKLVSVLNAACLMENTPVGIRDYCDTLTAFRQPGKRIGSIVMNANPFTLGHRHLVLQALKQCDWLHVFVVAEDASTIAYADRLELVRTGLEKVDRVTVHGGSRYLISKATFPSYFIKESRMVEACSMAVDLLLFRKYIAPALGITHRFVGTEPFCPVTRKYNQDLHEWLDRAPEDAPAVHVVEFPRLEINGRPVSATDVRKLLAAGDFEAMALLAPAATVALLHEKYAAGDATRSAAQTVEV